MLSISDVIECLIEEYARKYPLQNASELIQNIRKSMEKDEFYIGDKQIHDVLQTLKSKNHEPKAGPSTVSSNKTSLQSPLNEESPSAQFATPNRTFSIQPVLNEESSSAQFATPNKTFSIPSLLNEESTSAQFAAPNKTFSIPSLLNEESPSAQVTVYSNETPELPSIKSLLTSNQLAPSNEIPRLPPIQPLPADFVAPSLEPLLPKFCPPENFFFKFE